ncbi:MAG: hypothetical protein EB036_01610 [Betaproteobacteria bacterium]|nr:hypothetical protein [Betaproteobacteria bacterium]
MGETDRRQFRGAVFVAGKPAVGGVGAIDQRRDAGDCQQTTEPRTSHVCCLFRGRLLSWVWERKRNAGDAEVVAHFSTFSRIDHKLPAG